jgi:hypothetical protein
MMDKLEQELAEILTPQAALIIRRMIDASQLKASGWAEDAQSPQEKASHDVA